MPRVMLAGVAVEKTAYHFDKLYDYLVPETLMNQVERGTRVKVPFGGGNSARLGVVMAVHSGSSNAKKKYKPITAVLDQAPLLNDEMCRLAEYMKERTFCSIFDAVKCMVPAGLNMRLVAEYAPGQKAIDETFDGLNETEVQALRFVLAHKKYVPREKILDAIGLENDNPMPERLWKKGYLVRNDEAVQRIGDLTVKMVRLCPQEDAEEVKLTKKQQSVVGLLREAGCACVKEVCYFTGVTPAVPEALVKKGVLEYVHAEVLRNPYQDVEHAPVPAEICLTPEQQAAYDGLCKQLAAGASATALLYGITGSGKTQVYLKLIDQALAQGKGVIVLVPEISLTPQAMELFHKRYGRDVAVLHSALSIGERADEYKRVKGGSVKIVVGTRSAVFAPVKNLGLVIMDEEQEPAYKSESTPRYHARDIAKFRCAYHSALLLLASATPSVESYTAAKRGVYALYTLTARYGEATLPEVLTVDMLAQINEGVCGAVSQPLLEALQENLETGRQSILLINRRGYQTFVACPSCKHILTCPHCSISMTYHTANDRLMCHYCGYSRAFEDVCPSCGREGLKRTGFGTQRVEEELGELLPTARVLRMDTDTTAARFAHEKKFKAFADGEYDIMLGTQMVAKGLDFENVTLVGVVSADGQLYSDDYRSLERTFALLTQVVGRAGRGGKKGRAIIQTMTPENPVVRLAQEQDYEEFYHTEMEIRKLMTYPPFCDLCVLTFSGLKEPEVSAAATQGLYMLKALSKAEYPGEKLIVLGPVAPRAARIAGKYRRRLILKCRMTRQTRALIARLLTALGKDKRFKQITVYPDVNPETIF